MFKQAVRTQARLRMTIDGPAGSGKTYTALRFAMALAAARGGKVALVDTEHGSASKYAGEKPDGIPFAFDVVELSNFSPQRYVETIKAAERGGYSVLVIDSLSHAWTGTGGALDIKDRSEGNDYTAWRSVTPIHNAMVEAILASPMDIITTMRSKMDYVMETNDQGKILNIKKVGLAPVQRAGMEYEFDVVADMDWNHIMTVSKSRISPIADMRVEKPGKDFIDVVIEWLQGGEPLAPKFAPPVQEKEITLDELVNQYGAEKVMEICNGQLPTDAAGLNELAKALAA